MSIDIPRLVRGSDRRARLIVDGAPFLIRGAELHNSSTSTPSAIENAFASLTGRNVNTVLAPVAWEIVEPSQGAFDFTVVDELIRVARSARTRLIILWFGSWKNGRSTYIPGWVKRDPSRFPRAAVGAPNPQPIEHLSPFGEASRAADARAFARMLDHVRDTDTDFRTVVIVQVENEVGLLGDGRDRSPLGDQAFAGAVPPRVFRALEQDPTLRLHDPWRSRGASTSGGWSEVFGESLIVDEAFMADAYAAYVGHVAAEGRRAYDLPCFANAWLDSEVDAPGLALAGGQQPGIYPSGGPLPHVAGIWKAAAPSLDLLVPDIYFGDFGGICVSYAAASDGLFIPEMRRDETGAADLFLAIGAHGAIGGSPFGIDSFRPEEGDALRDAYALLQQTASLITAAPGSAMTGFHLDESTPEHEITLGGYSLSVRRFAEYGSTEAPGPGYGLIIQTGPDSFTSIGRGFRIAFAHSDDAPVGLLRAEELHANDFTLTVSRVLNGDETYSGGAIMHPPRDFRNSGIFPIPASTGSTGITRFELYRF